MSIVIELPAQELAALRQLTQQDDDAEAVIQAAREFLRIARLRELKAISGKVEFDLDWRELEQRELDEVDFPR
jgi:hypothetical protein